MSRLLSFQAGVERATNTHNMTTTNTSEWTTYRPKTEAVDANRLNAVERRGGGESVGRAGRQ